MALEGAWTLHPSDDGTTITGRWEGSRDGTSWEPNFCYKYGEVPGDSQGEGPGAGAAMIDPGPRDEEHAVRVARATTGRRVELVLLTHTHVDHAEGARALADRLGAPLAALDPGWATTGAPALVAGTELVGGVRLEPLPTPGHSADHCCFWLAAERAMFTGDHVLGRGSTVVEWPGGDMRAYLDSLEAVRRFRPERLYPGHGPVVTDA